MPSTQPDPPPQLLESRPDWAAGVATTAGRKELVGHWVGAVIMNALGLPVGWMALFGGRDLPVYLEVVLPSFTLLGLLIFFVAVRESFRWRRFGRLTMTLDPLPGSIGGHVGGSLELPIHQAAASDCRVMLMCIRDRLVKTKDGSTRNESVEWAKETLPDVGRSGSGVRLRYTFEVPEGLPPSGEPSDDYHKWVIRVKADLPGADLDQVFEVPVLLVDPPLEAREPTLSEATAAEVPDLSPRVVRVHRGRGGLTLYFPAGRGGLGGLMLLIFGAVFAGAGVFAFATTTDIGADGVIGGGHGRLRRLRPPGIRRFRGTDDAPGPLHPTELPGRGNPERQGDRPQEFLSAVQSHSPLRGISKNRDGRTQPGWARSQVVVPREDSGDRPRGEAHFFG